MCCPNPNCGYVGVNNEDCPECGSQLEKVKGDDYLFNNDFENGGDSEPVMDAFEEDPDAVSWYQDLGEAESF